MEDFTVSWAAEKMHARVIGADAGSRLINGICTDSRKAEPGALFFALIGEHADGHAYVPQALARGAVTVEARETERGRQGEGERGGGPVQLVVEDPLKALGELARAYRRLFTVKVLGITGSVGKTSTKEMTAHILRSRFGVLATEKNYNNEIGVPLTLFGLNRTHEAAVVEMGMRALGEIRTLADIAQPDIAMITNIGHAHEEMLGSRKAIAEAKAEILERLPTDGAAILPDDLPYSDLIRSKLPTGCRIISVGNPGSDVWAETSTAGSDGSETTFRVHLRDTGQSAPISLRAPGTHHRSNALLAIAAACELGVPLTQAAAELETWVGADGRMTVKAGLQNITVLDDCYNAGPESMKSALDTLRSFKGPHVAVLGDMRELGAREVELHETVGRYTLGADLRLLIAVGPLADVIAETALKEMRSAGMPVRLEIARFASTGDCEDQIDDLVRSGDVVLVKGSRAMQMERIVARLVGEQISDHHG
jgi:UDP-N-acetylmuramoyl-tripeptide--D-alanyl-D-alanine ligase